MQFIWRRKSEGFPGTKDWVEIHITVPSAAAPLMYSGETRGKSGLCNGEQRYGKENKAYVLQKDEDKSGRLVVFAVICTGYAVIVWILIKFNAYRFSFASIQ